MSFGLGHGKRLDDARGTVGISDAELGALPDDAVLNPEAGRVDPRGWFAEPGRAFELEIGSGKGTFLVQQAALQPETNFLGIEWTGEFYAYAADRIRRRRESGSHANVRMLLGDATDFLRWRCPDSMCRVIHLYFSDPWPKSRHHKKRVIQHRFLADAWRVLEPGGELRVVTDHADLWAWDLAHFEQWVADAAACGAYLGEADGKMEVARGLAAAMPEGVKALRESMPATPYAITGFDRPDSAGDGEVVGTNFERKFIAEGRSFNAAVLKKLV